MPKLTGFSLVTLGLIISSLVVGFLIGFATTSLTDLKYIFSPQDKQIISQCQDLNTSYQQLSILLRRYIYMGLLYDLRSLVVLVADTRVIVSISNLTSSPELLSIAKINLETAVNLSNRILDNIRTARNLTTSQSEAYILDQIRDRILITRANLENLLSDVNNAINTKSVPPDLAAKSDRLFNSVSQTIDEIVSLLKQLS
ncbi:MAG: hypothetical protein ACP5GI_01985 [Sulfolobales archaeon]